MTTKKVLLTGVGGSIGCHTLIHILHNTDWQIIGIDSFRHKGLTDRVTMMLGYHPEYTTRIKIYQHDLTAPFSNILAKRIGPVDYIIGMASLSDVHDSILHPVPFVNNNVQLILNTLEYVGLVQPRIFLLISTDEVYGPTDGQSTHLEWSSIVPSNPYSASKVCQEAIAISYWRSYGIPLIIANLMNNFGEMQSASKFPVIVQRKVRRNETVQIHTNDNVIGSRCYLHSRNCSDALLFILNNVSPNKHSSGGQDKPERFNIVGDEQIDNLTLAKLIAALIGKELQYELVPTASTRPGHDVHYGLDGSKLAKLGWKAPVPFAESLKNTVHWYEQNPDWLEPSYIQK